MVAWLFIVLLGALAMGMWVLANLHTWRRHRAEARLTHGVVSQTLASNENTPAVAPLAA